jgi:hypothetical protein
MKIVVDGIRRLVPGAMFVVVGVCHERIGRGWERSREIVRKEASCQNEVRKEDL